MRPIDADEFTKMLCNQGEHDGDYAITYRSVKEIVYRAIKDAPTVDAEPIRHGQWVKNEIREAFFECSCCHCNDRETYPFYKNVWKYCPNCGAKMDGVKE